MLAHLGDHSITASFRSRAYDHVPWSVESSLFSAHKARSVLTVRFTRAGHPTIMRTNFFRQHLQMTALGQVSRL